MCTTRRIDKHVTHEPQPQVGLPRRLDQAVVIPDLPLEVDGTDGRAA